MHDLGMIGASNLEQRTTNIHDSKSRDMSAVQRRLHGLRGHSKNDRVTKILGISQRMGYLQQATGTCWTEGKYGRKKFQEAAQNLYAAVDAGEVKPISFYDLPTRSGCEKCSGNDATRCLLSFQRRSLLPHTATPAEDAEVDMVRSVGGKDLWNSRQG